MCGDDNSTACSPKQLATPIRKSPTGRVRCGSIAQDDGGDESLPEMPLDRSDTRTVADVIAEIQTLAQQFDECDNRFVFEEELLDALAR